MIEFLTIRAIPPENAYAPAIDAVAGRPYGPPPLAGVSRRIPGIRTPGPRQC
jgi:hypothetical protein